MATRFYLVPKVGTGTPKTDPFRPKYFRDQGAIWRGLPYGLEPIYLVCADLSTSDHAAMVANGDVSAFPADLDQLVTSSAGPTVRATLESANIPSQWVADNIHKYSTVLKRVRRIFDYSQRFHKIGNSRLFPPGVTLETEFRNLTAARRQALLDVADDFGTLDRSGLSNTSTMREILTLLSGQFQQVDVFSDLVM